MRIRLLFLGLVAVALAGCGQDSASTGTVSADAVIRSVTAFAGEGADVSHVNALWKQAESGDVSLLNLIIACKPGTRDCLLVAPDGAGYPSFAEFVDDTKLLKPGDTVSVLAGLPDKPDNSRTEELTKSDPDIAWWTVLGVVAAGLVVAGLLVFVPLWLVRRIRGRRDADRLLSDWDLPPED
ncbi:hypothetical protein M8542_16155 [Amycolatopsis sp. OK19-0408]|uniref:Lipoprotein n=1 Tax=Amycolatopsis iheyensis TaxID=2945988 RepID=A0A9X2SJ32_9PSEU|nr:hypothetical protein [Amycolatopsis iheyensis]MCR6484357.1 hypothetical protein [Amycolatopsis iheyensis]